MNGSESQVVMNHNSPSRVQTGTQTVRVRLSAVFSSHELCFGVNQEEPVNIIVLLTDASPQHFAAQHTREHNLSCPRAHSLPRGPTQTVCLSVWTLRTRKCRLKSEREVCVPTRASAATPTTTKEFKNTPALPFPMQTGRESGPRPGGRSVFFSTFAS